MSFTVEVESPYKNVDDIRFRELGGSIPAQHDTELCVSIRILPLIEFVGHIIIYRIVQVDRSLAHQSALKLNQHAGIQD